MAYKSLYRKYRPNSFLDVCGQDFIIKTLQNALATDKVSHAYLFTGTRGTGKTTIAKILAKSVNCLNPKDGVPCGKCEICKAENTDEIQDIIEIDAASNNGVDEIRELKNKIKLMPVQGKYKVYIIDEVHMLSTGAFNALLKTLEEPPEHVIFILATTEPQKLPITIISRCQRFDFKKISSYDIKNRLKYISKQENIDIGEESIEEIANVSDGALRDAIGLLDQVSSFTDKKITIDDIYIACGDIPNVVIYKLIDSYINNDMKQLLEIIENLYTDGKDFAKLSEKILMIFRNVLINKRVPEYFDGRDNNTKEYINKISKEINDVKLDNIIKNLDELVREIKYSNYPRILFELFMLRNIEINEGVVPNVEAIKKEKPEIKDKRILKEEVPVKVSVNIVENEYTNEAKIDFDYNSDWKKPLINNTIAQATNKSKKEIQTACECLDKYLINKKYKAAATILKDANIIAASEDHILLTYRYVSMVESNDKEIEKIKNLLKDMLKSNYKIVAITDEEWKEARPYYLDLKKNNKIDIIEEIEEVKATNNEINSSEEADNELNKVIDVFGSELIEMEG